MPIGVKSKIDVGSLIVDEATPNAHYVVGDGDLSTTTINTPWVYPEDVMVKPIMPTGYPPFDWKEFMNDLPIGGAKKKDTPRKKQEIECASNKATAMFTSKVREVLRKIPDDVVEETIRSYTTYKQAKVIKEENTRIINLATGVMFDIENLPEWLILACVMNYRPATCPAEAKKQIFEEAASILDSAKLVSKTGGKAQIRRGIFKQAAQYLRHCIQTTF